MMPPIPALLGRNILDSGIGVNDDFGRSGNAEMTSVGGVRPPCHVDTLPLMADDNDVPTRFPWVPADASRVIGKGHLAGDFLEAWAWEVVDEDVGYLKVRAGLPDHVKNPRGQLFGGFTPTYVDLIALFTVRAGPDRLDFSGPRFWLVTTTMHIDYFEPVNGPEFMLESREERKRGRTHFVQTRFLQDGELAVLASTTMLERPME